MTVKEYSGLPLTLQWYCNVHFKPDETIFKDTVYHYDILEARMRELSFLNKGISISLTRSMREQR